MKKILTVLFLLTGLWSDLKSQTDSTERDTSGEDYSIYENVTSAGVMKSWCNPKIFDLSPNRFLSVGYDLIAPHTFKASASGSYDESDRPEQKKFSFLTHGLRLAANIPLVSNSRIFWQLGSGYVHSNYFNNSGHQVYDSSAQDQLYKTLREDGLRSFNLNTTIFKPLDEMQFLIIQVMGELSGNYSFKDPGRQPDLSTVRTSASILWGKRPNDRLQWAVGISRTYRAGEMNYIPVVLFNYTSLNRKWGTEILFPARAAYRRKFSSRSLLLAGYELEGSSYRVFSENLPTRYLELRRSELRWRLDYQRQLKGFIWFSFQAGIRQNFSFHADDLGPANRDFYRGFFGSQKFLMLNNVGTTPYFNISIHFVSP